MYHTVKQLLATTAMLSLTAAPSTTVAQPLELSQSQMRQLVVQQQILSAEIIMGHTTRDFDGAVIDIRGFLDDGRMTYRVLLQQIDGTVAEVMLDGQSGKRVFQGSVMGKAVSTAARSSLGIRRRPVSATETVNVAQDITDSLADDGATERNNRDNDRNNRGNKEGRGNGRS